MKNLRRLPIAFLPLLALASFALPARAEVVLSNLGFIPDGNSTATLTPSSWAAMRFVTDDSAPAFNLNSVTLGMTAPIDTSGNFFVALWGDCGGLPGGELATFSGTDNPAGGNFTFTLSGVQLAQNTSFWIVAGVVSGAGAYRWNNNLIFAQTGTWTLPATDSRMASSDQGSNWNANPNGPLRFALDASPVPEPGHYAALAALGALGLAVWRRCRRRQANPSSIRL